MSKRSIALGWNARLAVSAETDRVAILSPVPAVRSRRKRDDGRDYEVSVMDCRSWTMIAQVEFRLSATLVFGYGPQFGVVFSPNGEQLLIFDHDRYQRHEVPSGRLIEKVRTGLRTSPVVYSSCGEFLIFNASDYRYVVRVSPRKVAERVCVSETDIVSDIARSGNSDDCVFLVNQLMLDDALYEGSRLLKQTWPWKSSDASALALSVDKDIFSLDLAFDGERIAVCMNDSIGVYSCRTYERTALIDTENLPSVCWAPSGLLVYTDGDQMSVVDTALRVVCRFNVQDEDMIPREGQAPTWAELIRHWPLGKL
jgi:hypothetical protein